LNRVPSDELPNNPITNEIKFESDGTEKWAIGTDPNSEYLNSFFIWNHVKGETELFITSAGNVGIQTMSPSAPLDVNGGIKAKSIGIGINPPVDADSYKLWVEGGIAAREVKVTVNNFPDYCFDDDYNLMPLYELKNFISKNKHLPDMPSAAEINKNKGFELGDMQKKLVKKVEEQTLYILDLQKQLDEMKKQIENLTNR